MLPDGFTSHLRRCHAVAAAGSAATVESQLAHSPTLDLPSRSCLASRLIYDIAISWYVIRTATIIDMDFVLRYNPYNQQTHWLQYFLVLLISYKRKWEMHFWSCWSALFAYRAYTVSVRCMCCAVGNLLFVNVYVCNICEYLQKIYQQPSAGQLQSRAMCVEDISFASEVIVSCVYSSQYNATASHDTLLRRHFSSPRFIISSDPAHVVKL